MSQFPEPEILYYVADVVHQVKSLPDPVAAYRDFCKDLSHDSAITVSRSLAINEARPTTLKEFMTPREYEEFQENYIKLQSGIFKIADDCYAFGKDMLPINHFEYSVFCVHHGLDTIDLSKIPTDSAIIDIGAFIGDSALIFRRYLSNKIWSFEPVNHNYQLMLKTIEMNEMGDQVIPVRMALTSDADTKIFIDQQTAEWFTVASCHRTSDVPFGDILPSGTLDNFVQENNIKVGLIKVDIEGGEQPLLHGARETIARDRPVLLLSIYHPWSDLDYFNIKKLVESWNLGYRFRIFKPMDNNIISETLLVCEQ
jgi:FkbM family methyltransferase